MTNPFDDPKDEFNSYWHVAHKEDVLRSECDPEAAAKLLEMAAEYLENGEVVPQPLANFIALAFRRTASVEQPKRPKELAEWLNITAKNRRPKVHEKELGLWIFRQLFDNQNASETSVLNKSARNFGISKTTATTQWNKWKRKNPAFTELLKKVKPSIYGKTPIQSV